MENVCLCPNLKCKRHGKCEECKANHKIIGTYCKLSEKSLRKKLTDKLFRSK